MLADRWALVTAADGETANPMTVSWGGLGVIWSKPVATIYIRPQRYTHDLLEKEDTFTVSFYGEEQRDALMLCGTKSGRDVDKFAQLGLTPEDPVAIQTPGIVKYLNFFFHCCSLPMVS